MTKSYVSGLMVSAACVLGLGGCAGLPHFSHWVSIRQVKPPAERMMAREDGYYAGAKNAITRRDYARALELLQAARNAKPDDARILNAFGVVYDKLGRFDLSARYYAQAEVLDPTSPVLANNVTYSHTMQARAALPAPVLALAPAPVFALEAPQVPKADLLAAAPPVVRLGFAAPPAVLAFGMAGRPLDIADASGRAGGAEPVRQELIRLGWSVPRRQALTGPREARSSITYPTRSLVLARALARTLDPGVQLVDCGETCTGIRLTIGADAARWNMSARGASQRGD
ncbi:MAG TPA: LytR C-terminal domain-containing protein [Phenylobacterium sp.]|nr:LytR C-terminal domain-containing protein [Phenylobacterium sp.]